MKEEKVADEKKTEETPMDKALADFARKATGMLDEFSTVAKTLEERLTKRVEQRAVEQSNTMSSYEASVSDLQSRLKGLEVEGMERLNEITDLTASGKDIRRRMGEQGEAVKKVLATVREIGDKAGDRFGAKLEAMGTQVATLAGMGQRLQNIEQGMKTLNERLKSVEATTASHDQEIRVVGDRVADLLDAAKPKAEPKKATETA
jgi:chromosome segregation ATPase